MVTDSRACCCTQDWQPAVLDANSQVLANTKVLLRARHTVGLARHPLAMCNDFLLTAACITCFCSVSSTEWNPQVHTGLVLHLHLHTDVFLKHHLSLLLHAGHSPVTTIHSDTCAAIVLFIRYDSKVTQNTWKKITSHSKSRQMYEFHSITLQCNVQVCANECPKTTWKKKKKITVKHSYDSTILTTEIKHNRIFNCRNQKGKLSNTANNDANNFEWHRRWYFCHASGNYC